jgi:hypothetical protein
VTGFIKCLAIDDVDEPSLSIPLVEAAYFSSFFDLVPLAKAMRAGDSARNE